MGAIVFCGREIGERADGVVCPRIVEGKGQLARSPSFQQLFFILIVITLLLLLIIIVIIIINCPRIVEGKGQLAPSRPSSSFSYLIFVIFFTRLRFLENKIYTEKRQFFALNL